MNVILRSDKENIEVTINDDGPGFPEDIKTILGEPYIKSKSEEVSSNKLITYLIILFLR